MITAADRSTRQARELLAVGSGALLATLEECTARYLDGTGTIQTGPCRLVGAILNVGTEPAVLLIESDTQIVMRARMTSSCRPVFPPLPIACAGDLAVTITGAGADAVIYYVPV